MPWQSSLTYIDCRIASQIPNIFAAYLPTCTPACLPTCLSVSVPLACLLTHPPTCLPTYLHTNLPFCFRATYLPTHSSTHPHTHLQAPIHLPTNLPTNLPFYLPPFPPACLPPCLPTHIPTHLPSLTHLHSLPPPLLKTNQSVNKPPSPPPHIISPSYIISSLWIFKFWRLGKNDKGKSNQSQARQGKVWHGMAERKWKSE